MIVTYICGPMSGYPDLNEPAFREAALLISAGGGFALVPHDLEAFAHNGDCAPVYGGQGAEAGHTDGGCYLRGDLGVLLRSADRVYRLPGWSRSRGAQLECLVARLLRIPIEDAPDAEPGGSAIETLSLLVDEIGRQDAKWGPQNHPDGTGPDTYPFRNTDVNLDFRTGSECAEIFRRSCQGSFAGGRGTWRHVLTEEVGEAYAEAGTELSAELVQVAAVAVQWIAARERRDS